MAYSGSCVRERPGAIFLSATVPGRRSMTAMCFGVVMAPGSRYWRRCRSSWMLRARSTGASSMLTAPRFVPVVPRLVPVVTVFEADEPADHALGRSRGGFSTKLHLLCDGNGVPLSALL